MVFREHYFFGQIPHPMHSTSEMVAICLERSFGDGKRFAMAFRELPRRPPLTCSPLQYTVFPVACDERRREVLSSMSLSVSRVPVTQDAPSGRRDRIFCILDGICSSQKGERKRQRSSAAALRSQSCQISTKSLWRHELQVAQPKDSLFLPARTHFLGLQRSLSIMAIRVSLSVIVQTGLEEWMQIEQKRPAYVTFGIG